MHCNSNQGQMLIPQAKLCEMLGKSRSGLAKLRKMIPRSQNRSSTERTARLVAPLLLKRLSTG